MIGHPETGWEAWGPGKTRRGGGHAREDYPMAEAAYRSLQDEGGNGLYNKVLPVQGLAVSHLATPCPFHIRAPKLLGLRSLRGKQSRIGEVEHAWSPVSMTARLAPRGASPSLDPAGTFAMLLISSDADLKCMSCGRWSRQGGRCQFLLHPLTSPAHRSIFKPGPVDSYMITS